jgi:glycerol-3-phosphate dehydrogenase
MQYVGHNEAAAAPLNSSTHIIPAEIQHAIHEEMAETLADVVMRRTELGSAGHPGKAAIESCAEIMAAEMGWSSARKNQEIDAVNALFQ